MPNTVTPINYRIDITPDLNRFRFDGRVDIQLESAAPLSSVELNLKDLAVWRCRVKQSNGWRLCPFTVIPDRETLEIEFPERLDGRIDLQIDYQGNINDQMAGFYRSGFTKNGNTHYIAVTQFQESDARRAFPCMDHPRRKAVFQLSMTIPDHLTALANTLPSEEVALPGNLKRLTFAPTPKMSTYLLFFGVGEFELVQDDQDTRIRVAHLPGLADTTALGLSFGRKALQYCEHYYGIAYPLPKMDLIAVPDFAFGAMENWGAITFRENLLLQFPELTSKAGVQRICEVIAHEIAHQWFGNLVTPADWKYLWLNESFATYFGYGVVAHHHPQWGIWEQFLNNETATALARDGLQETFAIEMPGGEKMAINSSTAPIIYNKGASVLRMVEGLIGTPLYQNGVRLYLDTHQYDCAKSHHLWEAFEHASNQPITAMMKSWIEQPGYPLVTVERRDNTLKLHQKRFTYLDLPGEQTWLIPIRLTLWDGLGKTDVRTVLMETETMDIDLPDKTKAYKINSDQTGFYRTAYRNKTDLESLGAMIAARNLSAVDRWGVENDLYALVRQGTIPLTDYLRFLDYYANERDYLPLSSAANHLLQAYLTVPPDQRTVIAEKGRRLADEVLAHIGHQPAADDPQTTAVLRDQLLWQAVLWGSDQAASFARDQFQRLVDGHSVHADIAKAVMQAGAFLQGQSAFEWLSRRFEASPSEHERINILTAIGAFGQWQWVEKALAYTLEKVPPRNRFISIAAAAANPAAQAYLWDWYQANLDTLEQFHPLLYERVITAVWPHGGLDNAGIVRKFGLEYIQRHPNLTDAAKLALENLAINVRMRAAMRS
jgi:aminopeptidase N